MRLSVFTLIMFIMLALPGAVARADDMAERVKRGTEIVQRMTDSDRGFTDSRVEVLMTSYGASTGRRKSGHRLFVQEMIESRSAGEGDDILMTFRSPDDIRDMKVLIDAKHNDYDKIWQFLPHLNRIKPVPPNEHFSAFLNSDFAFGDFRMLSPHKYDFVLLEQETCMAGHNLECYIVDVYPKYQHLGHARQLLWIDTRHYQLRKAEYYNEYDELQKTLKRERFRQYNEAYWRPRLVVMEDHTAGTRTELQFDTYQFGVGLNRGAFTRSALAAAREKL